LGDVGEGECGVGCCGPGDGGGAAGGDAFGAVEECEEVGRFECVEELGEGEVVAGCEAFEGEGGGEVVGE